MLVQPYSIIVTLLALINHYNIIWQFIDDSSEIELLKRRLVKILVKQITNLFRNLLGCYSLQSSTILAAQVCSVHIYSTAHGGGGVEILLYIVLEEGETSTALHNTGGRGVTHTHTTLQLAITCTLALPQHSSTPTVSPRHRPSPHVTNPHFTGCSTRFHTDHYHHTQQHWLVPHKPLSHVAKHLNTLQKLK